MTDVMMKIWHLDISNAPRMLWLVTNTFLALTLANRTKKAPREMIQKLKVTLRAMVTISDHEKAVERELEPQLWSVDQPAFRERIQALKNRISKKKP
jgi:hypothetical protein